MTGTVVVSPDALTEDGRKTLAALVMRREGRSYEDIAAELGVQPWEARQHVSFAYARLSSEQADELRAQVEDRLDDVVRRIYADLRIADNQASRNALYGLLLKTEAQRSKLLGLDIPAGTPDYPEDTNA